MTLEQRERQRAYNRKWALRRVRIGRDEPGQRVVLMPTNEIAQAARALVKIERQKYLNSGGITRGETEKGRP